MNFTNDDIKEFIEIWKEEFKEAISEDEARAAANRLMELLMLLGSDQKASVPDDTQEP